MKIDISKTVSFSGHRILSPPAQADMFACRSAAQSSEDLRRELINRLSIAMEECVLIGFDTFLCGMAEGFDLLAGEAVISVQERHPGIRLIAVIPFPAQARGFSADDKSLYDRVLAASDDRVTICPGYVHNCFHLRNDFLVENSSMLLCYYNGSKGGTAYTVKQAVRRGLTVRNLL